MIVFENVDSKNFLLPRFSENFLIPKHCWDDQHRKFYKAAKLNNVQEIQLRRIQGEHLIISVRYRVRYKV